MEILTKRITPKKGEKKKREVQSQKELITKTITAKDF
jgi:hypothetical protein